ncbi:hypothetical protein F7725_011200 [Dissostichus mawsoni]|uniref:Netrin G1 n=1 Tax=Dissostichus mawsoni TaxID=36200 RepID=A0A7J5ZAC5_DISMA|nr:hypothetical protein F7725_011200 [Dissostichus mawsoni]
MRSAMLWPVLFALQAGCTSVAHAMQNYPAAWGHYDVCKFQIYTEEGLAWDYMACQPEGTDMTKYLRVALDPPNITCGDPPETYCALVSSNLARPVMETNEAENPYMCNNECDATTEELAHPPELMFDFEGRNPTTFWQSTSWKKYPKPLQVNITLSWNKTVELTDDIVLTFESGRPEQMVLEKSLDYGRTWTPYQFYATDCLDAFTMEPKTVGDLTQRTLLDIICTEDYSRGYVWKNDKTVRFEIKDRFALFAGPRLHNMASLYGQLDTTKNLRDFFTITDLRIKLLKAATGATMQRQMKSTMTLCEGASVTCMPTAVCLTRGSWAVSVNTTPQGQTAAAVRGITTEEPGVWAPTSPYPKEPQIYVTRVCDNAMLRCQNGGTCHHHQRCHCSPSFTGVLCERARCQGPGECDDQLSGQDSFHHPPIIRQLALTLPPSRLAISFPHCSPPFLHLLPPVLQ